MVVRCVLMASGHFARELAVASAAERRCLCEQLVQWWQVTVDW